MPIYNQVQTETITNGGGTISLACGNSTTTRYVFSGTATLAANWVIQPSGTPFQGMEFDIRWQSACTIGANSVTIFGVALTADQALNDLIITCYYNGSAWDVDIQQDGVQEIWETGTGTSSAKLVNGGTSTASNTNSVNAGVNNTVSGQGAFAAGVGNTASATGAMAIGTNCMATAANAVAIGSENNAIASNAVALGNSSDAEGDHSFAHGEDALAFAYNSYALGESCRALGDYSHAMGKEAVTQKHGEFAFGSGKRSEIDPTSDWMQTSKFQMSNYTTNATPVLLLSDGISVGSLMYLDSDCAAVFTGKLIAMQIGGASGTVGDSASWIFNGSVTSISGTTALVDTVMYQDNAGAWGTAAQRSQVAASAAWTAVVSASNVTDTLDITVTGAANKNIIWQLDLEITWIKKAP